MPLVLEQRSDGQVHEQMRGRFPADHVVLSFSVGKMKEPADVVVVVERGEQPLCFVIAESESGQRHGFAGLMRQMFVAVKKFSKRQHRNAARSISTHDSSGGSVAPALAQGKRENWQARPDSVRCLPELIYFSAGGADYEPGCRTEGAGIYAERSEPK